jgi:hypothetical protein
MRDNPVFNVGALNLTIAGKKPGFLSSIKMHRAKVPGGNQFGDYRYLRMRSTT